MAKQKGFIKLKGSLGGLTFYERNGNNLVRTTGGVNKNRIMTDPAYRRTRENMSEFGGSAKVGKALRSGLATIIKSMSDTNIVGRITRLMKKVNANGSGLRGRRSFEILANKHVLEGFEFNENDPFEAAFFAPHDGVVDANRSSFTLDVPDFSTDSFINTPDGATHFKLIVAVSVLSDYIYSTAVNGYEAVNPTENGLNDIQFSSAIPIGGMVGSTTTVTADLGLQQPLPLTAGLIVSLGIQFFQELNGNFYELSSNNAMQIKIIG